MGAFLVSLYGNKKVVWGLKPLPNSMSFGMCAANGLRVF